MVLFREKVDLRTVGSFGSMVFRMGVPSGARLTKPLSKSFSSGRIFPAKRMAFPFSNQSPSCAEMFWPGPGVCGSAICWDRVFPESNGPNADRSSSALRVCQWFRGHDRSRGWYQTRIGRLQPSIRMGLSRHRCLPKFFL